MEALFQRIEESGLDSLYDSRETPKVERDMERITFYSGDPLARLLIDRWRLTPISFALLSVVITLGIYSIIAGANNTLVSRPGQIGLLQDSSVWVWQLVLNPAIFGYYLWAAKAIGNLIRSLEKSDVLDISEKDIDIALSIYQKPLRKFLCLGIAVVGTILFFISRSDVESWVSSGIIPKLFAAVGSLLGTYMTSMLVLALIINVWVLQQILGNKELRVNPLHPDQCGGLRPLSQYSLTTAYLVAVFGVMIGFTEYRFITQELAQKYWILHLGIPLYIALSLACFFGPLFTAHTRMQEAKEKLLSPIAKQFHDDYVRTQTNLSANAGTLKNEITKIQTLRSFYALTNKFPVWPFDVQTLRRYLISVATPLLPPLIGLLQKFSEPLLKH